VLEALCFLSMFFFLLCWIASIFFNQRTRARLEAEAREKVRMTTTYTYPDIEAEAEATMQRIQADVERAVQETHKEVQEKMKQWREERARGYSDGPEEYRFVENGQEKVVKKGSDGYDRLYRALHG